MDLEVLIQDQDRDQENMKQNSYCSTLRKAAGNLESSKMKT